MGIIDMRQERAGIWEQMKGLHERATAEKRALTAEEREQWDRMDGELHSLKERIDREERAAQVQAEMAASVAPIVAHRVNEEGQARARPIPVGADAYILEPEARCLDVVRARSLVSGGEGDGLSMARWLRGVVTGNWRGADLELHETRAMGGGFGPVGGFAVPASLSAQVIDLARNKARIFQAGALTVAMDSAELTLARVTGDPTAGWKAENAPGEPNDMMLGALVFRPRTLFAVIKSSVELLEDSSVIQGTIEDAIAAALALELDRAALYGDGGVGPQGLRHTDGVQYVDMGEVAGAPLTSYAPFSQAWASVLEQNGEPNAVMYAPRTAGELDQLLDGMLTPLQPAPSFAGLSKFVTKQVPTDLVHGNADNATDAILGEWRNMLVAMRTELTIEVSRDAADKDDSAFRNLQVWIRAYLRADVGFAHPEHFCIIKGIVPPAAG